MGFDFWHKMPLKHFDQLGLATPTAADRMLITFEQQQQLL